MTVLLRRLAVRSLFVLLAAMVGAVFVWRYYNSALPMRSERVDVRVAHGAPARTIAGQLQAAGVEVETIAFVIAARAAGVSQSLRAGRYEIVRGTTLRQLLEKLRTGDVLLERLTIVEGWTVGDLRAALALQPELRHDSEAMSNQQVLQAIGATETHPEGLFAADTYLFDAGASDLEILRKAYRTQSARLQKAWEGRAPGLPYVSPYQALIMASIVEKETGQSTERERIAGVFVNRLRRGMLLQTDPTVIYGLGKRFDGNLRKRDLTADTPYNSYTRAGLPPTPIALPGRAAIEAALRPAATNELYFVARGDGTSQFSESLEQHNRAVAKYQLGGKAGASR